jgi:tRNA(Ile)-lysidine synthase
VSFGPEDLLTALDALEREAGPAQQLILGFSGGVDSTVLADLLAATRDRHGKSLLAVHVDHGLQPDSARFADHACRFAAERSLDFECVNVEVDRDAGQGLEAAARAARYAALAGFVGDGDWLLSAHHEDDQAETLLLNLLRGSGPLGIAAMPAIRRFADGWLARPLLGVSRETLEATARERGLSWCHDDSNDDTRFDRNFLRAEILPRLDGRWPDAAARLSRSAALAGDAAALLDELANLDLATLADPDGRLDVPGLRALSASRRANALRRAARLSGLPLPPAAALLEIDRTLLPARDDASPVVAWAGAEARRFRERLYLLRPLPDASVVAGCWSGAEPAVLGPGFGRLKLEPGAESGLDPDLVAAGLELRTRRGGEEIKTESQGPTRKLKKLLNERGIVPWMRDRLPMLYSGDRLVAVADLYLAADATRRPGTGIIWEDAPPLD